VYWSVIRPSWGSTLRTCHIPAICLYCTEHGKEVAMDNSNCRQCGDALSEQQKRRHSKYCSLECRRSGAARLYREANPSSTRTLGIAPSTIGAIGELLVSADLLKRGYNVFRSLSASADCDLVILTCRKLYRIEVTTGCKTRGGKLMYPEHDGHKYDILAVVVGNGITYFGELPEPTGKT